MLGSLHTNLSRNEDMTIEDVSMHTKEAQKCTMRVTKTDSAAANSCCFVTRTQDTECTELVTSLKEDDARALHSIAIILRTFKEGLYCSFCCHSVLVLLSNSSRFGQLSLHTFW